MRIVEPSRVSSVGYILVGGASSRFGRDKALVEFNGTTMIERMRSLLTRICMPEIYLVGNPQKYSRFGVQCIPDQWPGEGPLGGILTALIHTKTRRQTRIACAGISFASKPKNNFILSCDMPFLTEEWMAELFRRSLGTKAQVIVPRSEHGLEPMCACWRTATLPAVEEQFKHGVRRVTEAMRRLPMEVLDESVWKRFDKDNRLFWNMNTPADYEEARRILEPAEA
jgi:molybdopterin-guanine dinucleotide biosynthesis protein A